MKRLIAILLISSLASCTNPVKVGEERTYCTACDNTLNPYNNEGKEVKIINIDGDYLQYTTSVGDTIDCTIKSFNRYTYINGYNVGHYDIVGTIIAIIGFLFFLVLLFGT